MTEWMWQVDVEGDLFRPHKRTSVCRAWVCVPCESDIVYDTFGTYRRVWLCNPWPSVTHPGFVVLRDEWDRDLTEQLIYEWRAWTEEDQKQHDIMLQGLMSSKKETRA